MIIGWPFSSFLTKILVISCWLVLIRCQLRPEEVVGIERTLNDNLTPVFKGALRTVSRPIRQMVAYAEAEGIISPPEIGVCQTGVVLEFKDSGKKENIKYN
eukprot:TRINITY_DN3560_c0_g1_i5.p4 TRINITY_DN3560_c0_g1~~TRINITY_DN3560_c0_g1_i5.p4  ORF type:complete len:101 (-),score=12.04 TRINITY_DN3560_c0_g1_i5:518-820(-)